MSAAAKKEQKAQHTPGPWKATYAPEESGWDYAVYPPGVNSRAVAVVSSIGEDFSEANATLIAAAPELLEALRIMVERDERTGRSRENPLDAKLIERARAAIAKAEGSR